MEEKILQAIEGLAKDFNHKFDVLSDKVDNQGKQISLLSEKVESQGKRIDLLSEKVESQGKRIDLLSEKMDNQGAQVKENTQILKALEHLAQVNKAEHDKMSFNIVEISAELKAIRKDLANVEIITASNWSELAKLKAVK